MKLSLSTAASPGVALDALDAACRARGLDGVELVVDAHDDIASLTARVQTSGARVVALRAEHFDDRAPSDWAKLGGALGVPVSAPAGSVSTTSFATSAGVFAHAGARLLVGVGTDLGRAVDAISALRSAGAPSSIGLAWELRPRFEDIVAASAVLLAIRERLDLVRLHGGGPEQHDAHARGVGPLFVDLALSRYTGPIVLTPSSPEELPRWREWLASRRISGCGTAHAAREHAVDVRDVEPKDRLATILGAYGALPRGATLRITLDHDPSCMQYALEASEPAGSFAFRKIGDGPEVWRAEVTRK